MKSKAIHTALAVSIVSIALSTGCEVRTAAVVEEPVEGPIVVQEVEPAPIVEVVPERPAVGYVWVGGVWYHDHNRWVWHRGHWRH
jgi:hypothetical protein